MTYVFINSSDVEAKITPKPGKNQRYNLKEYHTSD